MVRDTETDKPRFDLLLPERLPHEEQMLTRWAYLMARGADKYSVSIPVSTMELVDLCSCENHTAIHTGLTTLMAFAEAVTSEIYAAATPSSPSASGRTGVSGVEITLRRSRFCEGVLDAARQKVSALSCADGRVWDYLQTMESDCCLTKAIYALSALDSSEIGVQISTTITEMDWREAFFARVATRLLVYSPIQPRLWGEHSSTCKIRQLTSTSDGQLALKNDRNWEKADGLPEFARYLSSAFRHFMQWYSGVADGEDHAAAVFFNIAAAEYVRYKMTPDVLEAT
jgi:hypothetical protein